ncbi:UNVERIFIED_CONTAM: hypothetical protein FKN15_008368 [Acipenser sinensis]
MEFLLGSPFASPVGQRIDKATDGSLQSEDWGLNIEICDIINETEEGRTVQNCVNCIFLLQAFKKCIHSTAMYVRHRLLYIRHGKYKAEKQEERKKKGTEKHVHNPAWNLASGIWMLLKGTEPMQIAGSLSQITQSG